MPDPKIELDIDRNLNATAVITCGQCRRKTRKALRAITPGQVIPCSCGASFAFTGDDLRQVQRSFDDLKRTLDRFGK